MKKYVILLSVLMITACSSKGLDRRNKNSTMQISYGVIVDVEDINLQSEAGKKAAIGGLWGLAGNAGGNREDMARGAAGGALLKGLTTKIQEGSSRAWGYTVKQDNGQVIKVISDNSHLKTGECAVIETGETTNIRHVAEQMCQANLSDETKQLADQSHQGDADECHQAKQALLMAETEESLNRAKMKVEVLCH